MLRLVSSASKPASKGSLGKAICSTCSSPSTSVFYVAYLLAQLIHGI